MGPLERVSMDAIRQFADSLRKEPVTRLTIIVPYLGNAGVGRTSRDVSLLEETLVSVLENVLVLRAYCVGVAAVNSRVDVPAVRKHP